MKQFTDKELEKFRRMIYDQCNIQHSQLCEHYKNNYKRQRASGKVLLTIGNNSMQEYKFNQLEDLREQEQKSRDILSLTQLQIRVKLMSIP